MGKRSEVEFYNEEYGHKSFKSLYRRVAQEFQRLGIRDVGTYQRFREARDYLEKHRELMRIEFGFARNMACLLKQLKLQNRDMDGIGLVVDQLTPRLSHGHLAKAIAFSQTTYLMTSDMSMYDYSAEYDLEIGFGPDLSGCLELLYKYKPDVLSGYVTPMPDEIHLVNFRRVQEILDKEEEKRQGLPPRTSSFIMQNPYLDAEELLDVSNIMNVSLTGRGLMTTDSNLRCGLVLPSLASLPLATVRKLREDHADEFVRFQCALRDFAEGYKHVDGEGRFLELLKKIESEVAALRQTIELAKAKHRKSLAAVTLATGVVFCLMMPAEAIASLKQVLEGTLSGSFAAGIFHLYAGGGLSKSVTPKIESSPYYFPFRMHHEGRKIVSLEMKKSVMGRMALNLGVKDD